MIVIWDRYAGRLNISIVGSDGSRTQKVLQAKHRHRLIIDDDRDVMKMMKGIQLNPNFDNLFYSIDSNNTVYVVYIDPETNK